MEDVLFPMICFLWLIGLGLLIYTPLQIRKRPRGRSRAACALCGYDLTGLMPEAKCPECGADSAARARSRPRLEAQGYLAFLVPMITASLVALSMVVYELAAVLVGFALVLVPMPVLALVLMTIERHVRPVGMVGYALAATLPPAVLLGWVSHELMINPDAQAGLVVWFAWIYAIGASGLGLGVGWLIEWRWVRWTA